MNEPQEGAEGLQELIAAVLGQHLACDGLGCSGGPEECQDRDFSQDPHKVAAKLIAELGLAPELLHLNEYAAANGAEPEIRRRWVTKWEQQA